MPCIPGLWWSSRHSCFLGLTLLLLVCEIITSRLCNSLINMVDSFHTLFVFLRLSFLFLPPHQPPAMPSPTPSLSSTSTPPSGASPVSLNLAPLMTSSPVSSLYPSAPVSSPGSTPTPPSSPVLSTAPSLSRPYGWARVRPLGALISALLLAALCVSASVDIVSEALWPQPTEYPLLVTAVGAVGLLFNMAALAMGHGGQQELERGGPCPVAPRMGTLFSGPGGKDDTGEAQVGECSAVEPEKDQVSAPNFSTAAGRTLQDEALMFCNPGASSVLDPDRHSQGQPPPPLGTIPTSHTFVSWCHPKMVLQDSGNPRKPHCGGCRHNKPSSEAPENGGDSDAGITVCPLVPAGTERPVGTRRCHPLPGIVALVQALVGSVLVLANGLVLLQREPGCLHSTGGCGPLVYLDPCFSALAALVFLATALPQACRHGYLLLQGTPPHFALGELSQRIAGVPGVLAVHDLHVWQLTAAQLVASVHVHCGPGLGARGCSDLLAGVAEVLRGAGVRHATVQPEFLPASPASAGVPLLPPLPHCSLACGAACARKLCCSPREEGPGLLPSAGKPEDVQPQAVIIENTYL